MRRSLIMASSLVVLFVAGIANAQSKGAQPLDSASEQALQQTQNVLRNHAEREKALDADPAARAHDNKIRGVLGGQTENAYELSAQLAETIVNQAGGDQAKLKEIMSQLTSNPNALEQYLTPAQREKIRSMASEMEKQKGNQPNAPNK